MRRNIIVIHDVGNTISERLSHLTGPGQFLSFCPSILRICTMTSLVRGNTAVTMKIMRMRMTQTVRVVFHILPSFADIQAIDDMALDDEAISGPPSDDESEIDTSDLPALK